MEKFINIAQCLRKLNNFNLLTAVVCGINNSSVLRLKWTREKMSKQHMQTLKDFELLMNMEFAYKNYREVMREVIPPCIPYLGVYLQDLTFIDEGNPDKIGPLINFSKRQLVAKIISEIDCYKRETYRIVGSKGIENFWNQLPRLSDGELYRHSLICEPRNAFKSDLN